MSIIYKIITVLSRLYSSSWPSGDDPFILRGLLVNMTRRFSVVTSVRNLSAKVTRTVGLLTVGRNFYFTIIIYALTKRMLFKYFAWRPKVVPVSTLTRLNLSRALVSMITCLAKENFESNLLGFIYISTKHDIATNYARIKLLLGVMVVFQFRLIQAAFWSMVAIKCRCCCIWVRLNVWYLRTNFVIEQQHTRRFSTNFLWSCAISHKDFR